MNNGSQRLAPEYSDRVKHFEGFEETTRVPVWIDGEAEPISIIRKNLLPVCPRERDYVGSGQKLLCLGSAVGRDSILTPAFKALVNVDDGTRNIRSEKIIRADANAPRFMGLLEVIKMALVGLDIFTLCVRILTWHMPSIYVRAGTLLLAP
jgi:hypothetical protein